MILHLGDLIFLTMNYWTDTIKATRGDHLNPLQNLYRVFDESNLSANSGTFAPICHYRVSSERLEEGSIVIKKQAFMGSCNVFWYVKSQRREVEKMNYMNATYIDLIHEHKLKKIIDQIKYWVPEHDLKDKLINFPLAFYQTIRRKFPLKCHIRKT